MSENNKPTEMSSEELDTVAGGVIAIKQIAAVDTDFEAVGSGAAAAPGLLTATDGVAINDETRQIAFRQDFVD